MVQKTKLKSFFFTLLSLLLFLLAISLPFVILYMGEDAAETAQEYLRTHPQLIAEALPQLPLSSAELEGITAERIRALVQEYPQLIEAVPEAVILEAADYFGYGIAYALVTLGFVLLWNREERYISDRKPVRLSFVTWMQIVMLTLSLQLVTLALATCADYLGLGGGSESLYAEGMNLPIMAVVTFLLAPLFEECFFRGIFFNRLRSFAGVRTGLIVSSLLFGLMHGLNINALSAGVFGLLWALLYLRSGDLRPSIISHMTANALPALALFLIHSSSRVASSEASAVSTDTDMVFAAVLLALFIPLSIHLLRSLHRVLPPLSVGATVYSEKPAAHTTVQTNDEDDEDNEDDNAE